MASTTTIKNVPDAHFKPWKETVKFLLDYSKSMEVKKSESGKEFVFLRN